MKRREFMSSALAVAGVAAVGVPLVGNVYETGEIRPKECRLGILSDGGKSFSIHVEEQREKAFMDSVNAESGRFYVHGFQMRREWKSVKFDLRHCRSGFIEIRLTVLSDHKSDFIRIMKAACRENNVLILCPTRLDGMDYYEVI